MSDGAGEVIEIGSEVTEFKIGDKVMALFFPGWTEGEPSLRKIAGVSGETIDGYMAEMSCLDQMAVTKIPEGYQLCRSCYSTLCWFNCMEWP